MMGSVARFILAAGLAVALTAMLVGCPKRPAVEHDPMPPEEMPVEALPADLMPPDESAGGEADPGADEATPGRPDPGGVRPVAAMRWITDHEQGLKQAREQKKRVILYFNAPETAPGRAMDTGAWSDLKVRKLTERFVCIMNDVTHDKTLAREYEVEIVPAVILLRPDGSEIDRIEWAAPAERIVPMLEAALKK